MKLQQTDLETNLTAFTKPQCFKLWWHGYVRLCHKLLSRHERISHVCLVAEFQKQCVENICGQKEAKCVW